MKNIVLSAIVICIVFVIETTPVYSQIDSSFRFKIRFEEEHYSKPQDGRILLLLSDNNEKEPRFQIIDGPETQIAFGVDVDNLKPGGWVVFEMGDGQAKDLSRLFQSEGSYVPSKIVKDYAQRERVIVVQKKNIQ